MRANAIEAAEQCGILTLPEIDEPLPLEKAVAALAPSRLLVFCDEAADGGDSVDILTRHRPDGAAAAVPVAVLIGPEGGFSEAERAMLSRRPNTLRVGLGPRILRADTAAVAALTIVQAVLGDWR
jgi:16S rRNA (uracil1498-N3)-methyltransferase